MILSSILVELVKKSDNLYLVKLILNICYVWIPCIRSLDFEYFYYFDLEVVLKKGITGKGNYLCFNRILG